MLSVPIAQKIIVLLGWVDTYGGHGEVSEAGVPLRPSIVIDSLFTKNMHNEFIIARPACRAASTRAYSECTRN